MKIKNINRYAPLAVGVNPSAMQGEARLRGLGRNNYSKTITHRSLFCSEIVAALEYHGSDIPGARAGVRQPVLA